MGKDLIGLLLVVLGVGLAAGFGARNDTQINEGLVRSGRAAITGGKAKAAFEAYCKARKEAELAVADGCPDPEAKKAKEADKKAESADAKAEDAKPPTREAIIAKEQARIADLKASTETLTPELSKLRTAWLEAESAAIEPAATAKTADSQVSPSTRVSEWFSVGGLFFLLGIALIVGGSIVARQAAREKASAAPEQAAGDTRPPKDFRELLGDLEAATAKLAADATAETSPQAARYESLRLEIEALQFDMVEPLIDARGRLQVRYGMAVFAAVFSPLSGGERNLNRAWSALVDEHWPEAVNSLKFASRQFELAGEELQKVI